MGQYHFTIPDSDRFREESIVVAQIVGLEGIPWPCKTGIEGSRLTLHRNLDLSGRLLVPFRTSGFGELALTTGTLPEMETPYLLDLELARGGLSRLRNQISIWREGGLDISPGFDERVESLIERFAQAVFIGSGDENRRVAICEAVIDETVALMFELTDEFSRQIAALHQSQPQNVPVIAGTVETSPDGKPAGNPDESLAIQRMEQPVLVPGDDTDEGNGDHFDFTATARVVDWLTDETAHSVRICGPLMQFDNTSLPDWMPQDASFEKRLDATRRMCRSFGNEFQKRIKILHVASGISGVGHQYFNYPQQLQMTLEMLESLDQSMPSTSMMVSFDQPWGERLSMATGGVQSMEIADALLRYGARISAIGLEFNLDYSPQGTLMRDSLQWVDLIDRWSQFGLPLAIYLSAPTGNPDTAPASRFMQTIRNSTGETGYLQYLTTVFNLLVRRPAVNVIAWRRTWDSDNRRFPLGGLIDEQLQAKPAYHWFADLVNDVAQEASEEDTLVED